MDNSLEDIKDKVDEALNLSSSALNYLLERHEAKAAIDLSALYNKLYDLNTIMGIVVDKQP